MNYKVILLGDSTVGKTCMATVASQSIFPRDANSTVGANVLNLNYQFDNAEVKLTVWDTAGQEKYRCLAPMYYRNLDCAVIIYSIDSRKSFEAADFWIDSLQRELPTMPLLYLVGNKRDLENQREVPTDEAQEYAKRNNMVFFEISALTSAESVTEIFRSIAKDAKVKLDAQKVAAQPIRIEEKESGCC